MKPSRPETPSFKSQRSLREPGGLASVAGRHADDEQKAEVLRRLCLMDFWGFPSAVWATPEVMHSWGLIWEMVNYGAGRGSLITIFWAFSRGPSLRNTRPDLGRPVLFFEGGLE